MKNNELPSQDIKILTKIHSILYNIGGNPSYVGMRQLAYGALIAYRSPESITLITKYIYPDVAKHYHTTISAVERNMRYFIESMYINNPQKINAFMGYECICKPTNTQFIYAIVNRLRLLNGNI